jgi:hypothetical protein
LPRLIPVREVMEAGCFEAGIVIYGRGPDSPESPTWRQPSWSDAPNLRPVHALDSHRSLSAQRSG